MVYRSPIPDIHIPEQDIYHVLLEHPTQSTSDDARLFIDGTTNIGHTFDDLRRLTKQFAGALQVNFNAQRGQVLALYSPNSIDYPVVAFGALAAGLVVTTANAAYTASELTFQLRDASASFLVADYAALDTAVEAATRAGIPRHHIIVAGIIDGAAREQQHRGHHTVYSFLATSSECTPVRLTAREAATQTAYLCYSSGTTGQPKGVELTHRNILANVFQYAAFEHEHWKRLPARDVLVGFLPFYHIYGLTVLIHVSIHRRVPVIVMRRFQLDTFLQHVERYRITMAYVAPPVCLALAKDPLVDRHDLSSLREVLSGAAPLGPALAAAVRTRLGILVRQASGMSETSPVTMVPLADSVVDGSVGQLLPNMTAKVIDEHGREVAPGDAGELCVRGPNVMKGYLNNPTATANMIDADGYLHTGDVVRVDAAGDFYIVDRIKELIKYKGYQVAPAELEAILQTHEAIADAAVVPVQSEALATELPRAYVALKPSHVGAVTAEEVAQYVAQHVAPHKQLRGGVEFLDVVPRSPSGKILRKLLRGQANEKKPLAKI
ncbi:hypothetical protein SYNPS1DRAFT_32405 [Syncephalis pseudoplumigaleata]|uniref:4-coumarate-CoA ligase n=1 Tax=Syncephalis pseudoplumigaleata TaxID=1712513 RepID=A0A4P9Z6Y6_9FUNG|nr:hypothetical protein SYNPS1DRAFT_32405 [Syncephalis pseudoplumigaleata]|eukprot:RKP27641.1 hypothetical protein SYNPS1DRAFT_32405 [Syncephalis pseudoplumigaleata]